MKNQSVRLVHLAVDASGQGRSYSRIMGTVEDETLADVLGSALGWRLTDDEWRAVRVELDRLAEVWAAPDRLASFGRVVDPLIKRDGSRAAGGLADAAPASSSRRPMPSDLREVVYRLQRQIGATEPDAAAASAGKPDDDPA
jgi:hypothetical protein